MPYHLNLLSRGHLHHRAHGSLLWNRRVSQRKGQREISEILILCSRTSLQTLQRSMGIITITVLSARRNLIFTSTRRPTRSGYTQEAMLFNARVLRRHATSVGLMLAIILRLAENTSRNVTNFYRHTCFVKRKSADSLYLQLMPFMSLPSSLKHMVRIELHHRQCFSTGSMQEVLIRSAIWSTKGLLTTRSTPG